MLDPQSNPHRRYNPLAREWVLVSPRRAARPWLGQVEPASVPAAVPYDPACYLCPGNARAGDANNPAYEGVYVFDNDFPALESGGEADSTNDSGLLLAESERGRCRVVCYSPRHDLTLAQLPPDALAALVRAWVREFSELGAQPETTSVMIFENRGAMMGASNPHPHGQIWANEHLPNECVREQVAQLRHRAVHQSCLLCDYLALELERAERIVCANDAFVALVPYWAVWPFETMVLSRRHLGALDELSGDEQVALADILRRLTTRYDNLFQSPFPYSMGFHQRPTDGKPHPEWHFHAHFLPPLLRSATVRKFLVGYELLGTPQRDLTAETAAAGLRRQTEQHYSLA